MLIQIRKCDGCGLDIRSDNSNFVMFARVHLPSGEEFELCPGCTPKRK